jgi:dihydroneopterin aldolase / 2-amino-4-hydroxy-6-hydroxymethyldihydropteridine diphosphokinase / dihydropteroate synthase
MVPDYCHPAFNKTIADLLDALPVEDSSMCRVIPFPHYPTSSNLKWSFSSVPAVPSTLTCWKYPVPGKKQPSDLTFKTHIMATLNVTPDSFSDGALHNTLPNALGYTVKAVADHCSMIDIGGYSTRPGADFVSSKEELNRVVPVIGAIRGCGAQTSSSQISTIPISIDTFRWEVAEAAIQAGASCINDVYAFTGDNAYPLTDERMRKQAEESLSHMKRIARDYAVPVVLMHSRGDAGKNKDYGMYLNGRGGSVIRGVQLELGGKVQEIIKGKGGLRRWMVIVDPGIGFSKTVEGNLEVLRNAAEIVRNVKLVDGTSRAMSSAFGSST